MANMITENGATAPCCDICAGPLRAYFPTVEDPQTGETFRIERCPSCDIGQTLPQPEDIGPYYGAQYFGGRHGVTDRLCMERRLGFVAEVARPGRLLDFGCGDGGFIVAAQSAGWDAAGVEMRPEDARARSLTVFEQIEEAPGSFDVITLWHSLEHVAAPRATVERLLKLLKPDGHMIIAVPNRASWQARLFGRRWFHIDAPRHLFHFTPKALRVLLERQGLAPVRRWNLELEIDLFGWTQSALNIVLPRPNVLFDVVTRRGRAHRLAEIVVSVALGGVVTMVTAPIVPIAAALGSGAIMVVAARAP
jgi:SAM-dependent methyltransferase